MTESTVSTKKLHVLLESLAGTIKSDVDLPRNVFLGEFVFWFFERPLICFYDAFSGLVSESIVGFKSDVFVKFLGLSPAVGSCFSITGKNLEKDILAIHDVFEDFQGGQLGYPILFFNESFDWVAFESAREEFGVIAVRLSVSNDDFLRNLNSDFISFDEFSKLAASASVESAIARKFISSYFNDVAE
ncbi:MAG: hypothetical protein ACN6O6_03135 [Pseudomonas sp.]|uniref:hypothetical protein n=1 Tax=Pseudomonas sp. TaxID=306 RepID=UPI003D113585